MALSDYVQSITNKVLPEKRTSLPLQPSSTGVGIGSGGHVPFEDDVSNILAPLSYLSRPYARHPVPLSLSP